MQFKSLVYLTSVIAISLGASVRDVLNDLSIVHSSAQTLDNSVKSFPDSGGTFAQVLAIHSDATVFQSAMDATTSDVQMISPDPVSETDGQTLINVISINVNIILDFLSNIVEKKPAFENLPFGDPEVSTLLLQDLRNLNASNVAKVNAFAAIVPADILDEAKPLIAELDVAYATAIAAYQSSQ